jgi:hypothetical protein
MPQLAAVRPKTNDGSSGQRFELIIWPTPDGVYHLTGKTHTLFQKLSAANPYPLGGAMHARTVQKACLAEVEEHVEHTQGPMYKAFMDALRTSIFQDRAQSPRILGYNPDNSDDRATLPEYDRITYVTVGGVIPT